MSASRDVVNIAEGACRKIFFDITNTDDDIETIKNVAMSQVGGLLKGRGDSSEEESAIKNLNSLVSVGMFGVFAAYDFLSKTSLDVSYKRVELDKEMESGAATLIIPNDKEAKYRSKEERILIDFIALFKNNPRLYSYLGIKMRTIQESKLGINGTLYSVIPGFRMRFTERPISTDQPSEKVCQSIDLFFATQAPQYLENVTREFAKRWWIIDVFRATMVWQGKNFLKDLRIRRILLTALQNLLWCLQYPADEKTGRGLNLKDKAKLCNDAHQILGQLLNREHAPDIYTLNDNRQLVQFAKQVEVYLEDLADAFDEEETSTLGMKAVASDAQKTARELGENVFKMVYKGEHNAATLASYVDSLNRVLNDDNTLPGVFKNIETHRDVQNKTPKTVIDVLIVFLHLDRAKQKKIIAECKGSSIIAKDSMGQFLESIYKEYIKPLNKVFQKAIDEGKLKGTLSQEVANRLLPLLALAVMDHRIDVDTKESYAAKRMAAEHGGKFYLGKEQVSQIASLAYENDRHSANQYTWDLSHYLPLSRKVMADINELPRRQYKLGQYTTLLDNIYNFVSQYKTFLLYPKFKRFLTKSLSLVNDEFSDLKKTLDKLCDSVKAVTNKDRTLVDTIKTMDQALMTDIDKCKNSIDSLKDKVTSADFEESLKENILTKLQELQQNFCDSFGQDQQDMVAILNEVGPTLKRSGPFVTEISKSPTANFDEDSKFCNHHEVIALTKLITGTLSAMSAVSQCGTKGRLLRQLLTDFAAQKVVLREAIPMLVQEIARISASYQKNWYFFHAEYACTKSSEALINTICHSLHDRRFPLAELLFGKDGVSRLSRYQNASTWCRVELKRLQQQKRWAIDADDLGPLRRAKAYR